MKTTMTHFVIPGELLGDASKFDCGDGVYERNGQLYSSAVGARVIESARVGKEEGSDLNSNFHNSISRVKTV